MSSLVRLAFDSAECDSFCLAWSLSLALRVISCQLPKPQTFYLVKLGWILPSLFSFWSRPLHKDTSVSSEPAVFRHSLKNRNRL
jgi:hypothetical protein